MSSALEVRVESVRVAPGTVVKGTVVTYAEVPGARGLEVFLGLYERTRDYRDVARETRTGPLHVGPVPAGLALPFAIGLPADAVPAYRSRWGALTWELDAKVDVARGRDVHAIVELDVRPPGVEDDQLRGPGVGEYVGAGGGGPFGGAGPFGGGGGGGLAGGVLAAAGLAGSPGGGSAGSGSAAAPDASAAPGSFPAAWYADPWLEKRLRYWDGQRWTSHTAD